MDDAAGTSAVDALANVVCTGCKSTLALLGTPFPGFCCLSARGLTAALGAGMVKTSLGFLPCGPAPPVGRLFAALRFAFVLLCAA